MPCKPLWDKDFRFFPSRKTTLGFKEKQKSQSVLVVTMLLSATEPDSPPALQAGCNTKKRLQDHFIN